MKNIAIIGAGIAGLAAGVYAQQSGFNVTIYESHYLPGGACTSWSRKGYLFEGGMHWLTGSSKKVPLNAVWSDIGALNDNVPIYNRDPFLAFEHNGQTAYLYRDLDRLEEHFLDVAPEDEKEIKRLIKDIRGFTKVSMPLTNVKGVKHRIKRKAHPFGMLSMLPALSRMPFYANQTAGEFAARFKNPLIRTVLSGAVGEDMSAVGLAFTLATLAAGDGGYPQGGSLAMAARTAETFEKLGGTIVYKTPVERVITEQGRTTGVMIDGEAHAYDSVIVTQDTLVAIDSLFDSPISDNWAQAMRANPQPLLCTFICLGIRADLSDAAECVGFTLDEPLVCAGQKHDSLSINNYATYEGYAPKGCTALTSFIGGDTFDWWQARKDDGTYAAEKQKLAEAVIAALSKKYPQIEGEVEVWDVATPLTYERYLHSYKGSWMSNMLPGEKMPAPVTKSEAFENVYFAGQRLMPPGGLPTAAETARTAVQHLCRDTDTVFQGALGKNSSS